MWVSVFLKHIYQILAKADAFIRYSMYKIQDVGRAPIHMYHLLKRVLNNFGAIPLYHTMKVIIIACFHDVLLLNQACEKISILFHSRKFYNAMLVCFGFDLNVILSIFFNSVLKTTRRKWKE